MFGSRSYRLSVAIGKSFKKVRKDLEEMRKNVHGWITFLHRNQDALNNRIERIEEELKYLRQIKN